ncbi:MAG: pyridoxal phosphate-dependent decarboxylase family protein [Kiloniellales bacterium]
MRDLLSDAAARAACYLEGLEERSVAPAPEAVARLRQALDGPLPDGPSAPAEVLAFLDDLVSPATVASAGPRYFGFVTGGALPASLAANWLAGAWDQNGFSYTSSPAVALIEEAALRWVKQALGLPAEAAGALVTGATLANFTCLAAARHRVLAAAGWDVERDGLFGAPAITVIVGEEVHATLYKVLAMLGLGRERVVRVPADAQGRMRAEALPAISGPTILCLQAGNVNSGAFDPAGAIIPRAREAGAWVHVDGAFGLWALASPVQTALARGYEQADSWATDAHKWLNVPYDCGLAIVRDEAALRAAMSISGAYIAPSGQRDAIELTPDSSRRARAVEVWAALKALGAEGLAELVARNCRQARRLAEGLAAAGHEVLNEVVLNQVVVAFGDEARTMAVIAAVQADGTCWCGGTLWQDRAAMRISVSSWATTDADIERSLAAILKAAKSF